MTPFATLIRLAGLSIGEASTFLGARLDTAKSWSSGRNAAPPGVLAELRGLIAHQERAAAEALKAIKASKAPEVEIGYPTDDDEARGLGFPCLTAWGAVAARIIAGTEAKVVLVPRGSTVATAGAADAHEV